LEAIKSTCSISIFKMEPRVFAWAAYRGVEGRHTDLIAAAQAATYYLARRAALEAIRAAGAKDVAMLDHGRAWSMHPDEGAVAVPCHCCGGPTDPATAEVHPPLNRHGPHLALAAWMLICKACQDIPDEHFRPADEEMRLLEEEYKRDHPGETW
jgi:hypothetical protein